MDKLDLLVGITLANYFRGGTFTPEGTQDKIRNAIAFGNKILQEDVAFRVTKDEEPLELTEAYMRIIAQSVGVYLQPEWAAKEGLDKTFFVSLGNKTFHQYGHADYAVPTGKTLYLTAMSFQSSASNAADADKNQMAVIYLFDTVSGNLGILGGNGGGAVVFEKPVVVGGGHTLQLYGLSQSNHAIDMTGCAWGYEV